MANPVQVLPGAGTRAVPMANPVHVVPGGQAYAAPVVDSSFEDDLFGGADAAAVKNESREQGSRCQIVVSSRPMGIVLKSVSGGGAELGIASVQFPEVMAGSRLVTVQAHEVARMPYDRIIFMLQTTALPITMVFDAYV